MATAKSRIDQAQARITVALVGGGSGGHITPLLAVAEELKKQQPNSRLVYIGQTGDKLLDVPGQHNMIAVSYQIRAGKFRRYHGEGLKQLLDIKTLAKNFRDFFYFLTGIVQAYKLLSKLKPDVVFIKGGFVGVPVGLAAAVKHIPYVTHDSDAVPGLANRLIAKWAAAHAVAMPKSIYNYPADKTFTVGVPINALFKPVSDEQKAAYKKQIGLRQKQQVIFVSGGGNGAKRLNEAVVQSVVPLLKSQPDLFIIHATGRDLEDESKRQYVDQLGEQGINQVLIKGFFVGDLYKYSGAADVVVTRAGATSVAEFAAQQKCCIIVPNPQLTGGHQIKNANYLAEQKAAIVLDDAVVIETPQVLTGQLQELLDNSATRQKLATNLAKFAQPRAAKELAQLLLETVA